MDHAAHHHMPDARWVELRPRQRLLDRDRTELGRRHVLERAAVVADRRARARHHHHFAHSLLPCRSCSSARWISTSANSPALPPLKCTTPSMSGASALDRPVPGSSTSTLNVLPTFCRSLAALIFA